MYRIVLIVLKIACSCIEGEVKKQHVIDKSQCIKCGNCETVCPVHAMIRR